LTPTVQFVDVLTGHRESENRIKHFAMQHIDRLIHAMRQ